ncbi:glycosyltransferase family 39 protein [Frondihabitans australicus]|uniref:Dolichyl-phosphate-mannose-protein mannosyltransferase n=1 Tax=Frondihabitans australicus TaxID=386892 RepID=A0A495IAK1_9MICO|nr:glycosyltransferase family 39 protein [Frondihabitans australicus]RKR72942.1 dolichyl-phosphate-mannose-protein mannosyltransferase [Frondihabitans australicus]
MTADTAVTVDGSGTQDPDPTPSATVDGSQRRPRGAFVVVSLVLAVVLAAVVANLVLDPWFGPRRYSMIAVTITAVVLAAALPFAYLWAGVVDRRFARRSRRANGLAVAGVVVAAFAILLVIGMLTLRSPGFDAGVVFGAAINLTAGHGLNGEEVRYFSMYPNNVFLTFSLWKSFALVKAIAHISGPPALFYALAVAANAAVLACGVLLTFTVARRVAGRQVAIFTLLPTAVLVVLSPWIGTVYSDTLGLVFPILVIYLFLRADSAGTTRARLLWWGGIGLVTAVGYEIKPTTVFAVVAVALVVLIRVPLRRAGARALLPPVASIVAALVVLGVAHVGIGAVLDRSGTVPFSLAHDTTQFPLTHFLKMGSHGTGGYDAHDVAVTRAIPTEAGKFAEGLQGYASNVAAQGPVRYAGFLAEKTARFLGDGTFYQWQEGGELNLPFIVTDSLGKDAQAVYGPSGALHPALVDLWQAMWTLVLLLGAAPLVLRRDRRLFGDASVAMRVAILGLIVFLMLFEGRSRYVYLYVPFFVVLAGVSMRSLAERFRRRDETSPDVSPLLGAPADAVRAERAS